MKEGVLVQILDPARPNASEWSCGLIENMLGKSAAFTTPDESRAFRFDLDDPKDLESFVAVLRAAKIANRFFRVTWNATWIAVRADESLSAGEAREAIRSGAARLNKMYGRSDSAPDSFVGEGTLCARCGTPLVRGYGNHGDCQKCAEEAQAEAQAAQAAQAAPPKTFSLKRRILDPHDLIGLAVKQLLAAAIQGDPEVVHDQILMSECAETLRMLLGVEHDELHALYASMWKAANEKANQKVDKPDPHLRALLINADPKCDHDIVSGDGGSGIKCSKCPGWYCT